MNSHRSRNRLRPTLLLAGLAGFAIVVIGVALYSGRQPSNEKPAATAQPNPTQIGSANPQSTAPSKESPEAPIVERTPVTGGPANQGQTPDSVQAAVVELAKRDLAAQQQVDPSKITVGSVEQVEWNDSSLGCPKPGQMYLQVITSGYRIVLNTAGTSYEYHSDRGTRVIFCTKQS